MKASAVSRSSCHARRMLLFPQMPRTTTLANMALTARPEGRQKSMDIQGITDACQAEACLQPGRVSCQSRCRKNDLEIPGSTGRFFPRGCGGLGILRPEGQD